MSLFQGHYACRKVTQPHRHYNIPPAVHQMTYTRVLLLWEDATLNHSCSLLMKTKKAKTAVYGFLDSRSLLLVVVSRVMSLTNQFTLLSGYGAFFAAGLYIFSNWHFILFKSLIKVKVKKVS